MSNKKDIFETPDIAGEKGKGGSRTPKESPNTLKSNSTARIIDLVGEGEIGGLINGLQSVYLDETPVQNPDGSFNFDGIRVIERVGTPYQSYVSGFPAAEQEVNVSTEVKNGSPIVRSINSLDVDGVRIKINIPALYKTINSGKRAGDIDPWQVSVAVEVKENNGVWQRIARRDIAGKNTAPYQESILAHLPGTGPWQVRVVRLSSDNDNDSNIQDSTIFTSYTEIIYAKLSYPDLAYYAIEVDAEQFGNDIPTRIYEVEGMAIQVPTNYDPETREYTGIWDGTFKLAVSDNPAWIFYDLATNTRYGAGLPNISKSDLYVIGKYCDELVPTGDGRYEPRFTINTAISSREDAYKVLNMVASAARMKLHWASGTLVPTQDKPTPPSRQFSNVNVKDGDFKFQGSAKKARHNVVNVAWNDPEDGFKQVIERVEDPKGLREMDDVIEADITAYGCTSRGQARRAGLWKLYTERNETDIVEFTTGLEAYDLAPSEVINIVDRHKQDIRLSGRVVYPDTQNIELDNIDDLSDGDNWQITFNMPNGGFETRSVIDTVGNVIQLDTPLSTKPEVNALWTMLADNIKPMQYRVLKVVENQDYTYTVTAQMHDPQKYEELESGIDIEDDQYTFIPTGPILSPLNIDLVSFTSLLGGSQHQNLRVSWTAPDDPRVVRYELQHKKPEEFTFGESIITTSTGIDINDVFEGLHTVRIRSIDRTGRASAWAQETTTVVSLLQPYPPTDVEDKVGNFDAQLRPISQNPLQEYEFWRSEAALTTPQIETTAIYVGTARVLTDNDLEPGTQYFYYIRGVNAYGVSVWYPHQLTTDFNPSVIIDVISGEINDSVLSDELRDRIDLIDGPASVNGSVNARLAALEALSDQADTVIQQQVTDLSVTTNNNILNINSNANAISGLDVRVTDTEEGVISLSQDLTALQSSLEDVNGNRVVTADAFNQILTRVSDTEGDVISLSQQNTQLGSQIIDVENDLNATSDALSQLTTSVSQIDNEVTTIAQDITTLQSQVNGNIASIQQKADITTVTDLNDNVTDILAQYTVKVDVNGNVAGFGLMNDGVTSDFYVLADRFAVIDPATQNGTVPFAVENGNVYLRRGVIAEASVGQLEVEDGAITNAKIGNVIQSNTYTPNQTGWRIDKNGNTEFNNIRARGIIEGSDIKGSTITGSAIIGTAFLAPTELDPGNNTYLAISSDLSWSDTTNLAKGVSKYLSPVDIYSANYSNTSQYRRFRRHRINARATLTDSSPSGYNRIIAYYLHPNGSRSVIGDTGLRGYLPELNGTYWRLRGTSDRGERCYTDCVGSTICETVFNSRTWIFELVNYPFSGNGRIQFWAYTQHSRDGVFSATVQALNDY